MLTSIICLALTVFHEARGEPPAGQRAVAQVVINRSRIRSLPICSVVAEKGQFSWNIRQYGEIPGELGKTGAKSPKKPLPVGKKGWLEALNVAKNALLAPDLASKIEFFHAKYVNPGWNRRYLLVGRFGNHLFYSRRGAVIAPS